jgi:hypothetical protein
MSVAEQAQAGTLDAGNTLVYPLPRIQVDVNRLQKDLKDMEEGFWIFQDRYKDGIDNWDGIALYSVNGDTHDLRCADHLPVHKTPAGEKCPYIANELLPQFGAPWLRVVFYRLQAGTKIGQHRDLGENRMMNGIIRIHIPVVTNERVVMYVAEKPYYFPVGTAWYFDATAFHRVENNGDADRIHLVVDFKLSPALTRLLKPLTGSDRIRLTKIAFHHFVSVATSFAKFIRTSEGRKRIAARARIVFGRSS